MPEIEALQSYSCDYLLNFFLNFLRRLRAVDDAHPSGLCLSQLTVGGPHPVEKTAVLGLEPVRPAPGSAQALAAYSIGGIEDQRQVRLQAGVGPARELVD